jgi:DNA-binding NarL/FixJ family response regulator
MSNIKKTIAVAEMSYIIRKGLVYSLSQLSIVEKVVEWKDLENLSGQSVALRPDAIVINPMVLGRISKSEIRQRLKLDKKMVVIALVYNMIDEQFYQSYDAVIRINDSEANIENILTNALKNGNSRETGQDDLSDRETEILKSLVKGMSNKEIADHHNISIHTVITHRRNIARKLEIHSVSGLTIYAIINKLVDVNDVRY